MRRRRTRRSVALELATAVILVMAFAAGLVVYEIPSGAAPLAAPDGNRAPAAALRPPAPASAAFDATQPVRRRPPAWAWRVLRALPAWTRQAVVVLSPSVSSTTNVATLWDREGSTWGQVGRPMPGRNGEFGWTDHRTAGDLRTPAGVYTITATGGRLPNPGTREPYEYRPVYFDADGSFLGHSAVGVFNYVVAIDFNRVPGSPVSSPVEPGGPAPGGGIWLHVGNGVATEGCVTLSQPDVATVLRWLDPADRPVIAMGPLG